jgi:serine/threonine-protein kinase
MKYCPVCHTAYSRDHTNCASDGALLIESDELESGTLIRDKYRILRVIGRGGMGTVYLAEHILLGRNRALKFLSSSLCREPKFLKRFRQEARASIELRHPNVVEVVDLDQAENGSPYIAMEYIEGPDLADVLSAGPLPIERALAVARGVASGLSAAHAKRIVHRDVKPENVLLAVGEDGYEVPKLVDFGIAAIMEKSTTAGGTRGLVLTPEYGAPEQWREVGPQHLDGRADLYAVGCMMYEMLTRRTAFTATTPEAWMHQHLFAQPDPPSKYRPEVKNWKGLDALVLRLLAKEKERRPRDAAELVALIDEVYKQSAPLQPAIRAQAAVSSPPAAPAAMPAPAAMLVPAAPAAAPSPMPAPAAPPSNRLHVSEPEDAVTEEEPVAVGAHADAAPEKKQGFHFPWGVVALMVIVGFAVWGIWRGRPRVPVVGAEKAEGAGQSKALPGTSEASPAANTSAISPETLTAQHLGEGYYAQNQFAQAKRLFEQTCTAGLSEGCNYLGQLYDLGNGVGQDRARAMLLYTQACNAGSAHGCFNRGYMYRYGTGGTQNFAQAVSDWIKACDGGVADGCNGLGYLYSNGQGVAKSTEHAAEYYGKACTLGDQAGCDGMKGLQY